MFQRLQKLTIDNSPTILTGVAVAGTVVTAVLTGKATFHYTKFLAEEGYYDRDYKFERTTREHVEKAWKLYIPAATTSLLTVTCIIGANRIGTRRAAAVAAAYTLSERAFSEYREKVVEKLGAKKEQAVRDELAQDRVRRNPINSSQLIIVNGKSVMCFEAYTGRYFLSDMETIRQAVNTINHKINTDQYASLTDFYWELGLPKTSISDDVGWNTDKLLDVDYSATMMEDGTPCMSIDYTVAPIRDFYRFQ